MIIAPYWFASVGGWWDSLTSPEGAWEAALAADQTASYTDLTGNGNDLTAVGGTVNWSSGAGWSNFAADTSCLYTGIDAPGEDKAVMVQFANVTNSAHRCVAGCTAPLAGNTSFSVLPVWHSPTTDRAYETQAGDYSPAGQQAAATMALCGGQGYLNGSPDGSAISTGTGTQSPIGLGAGIRRTDAQGGFAFDGHCDGEILRAVVWLRVPTDEEILALHDAWMLL